ncbi:hypothetical protein BDP27DRAFT_1423209 [Rhodocollybia butyracea]|uniref:Uncharacterized protein n=1 Tax=Rhodocollybia butyracea TaxID=206335 RepID=A0A9P5PRZ6_9AGAR|nr:hypothetical protein BDP27DRAFT_1423209 [Rhodocollybia butyracea]
MACSFKKFPAPITSIVSASRGPPLADLSGILANPIVPAPVAFMHTNPYGSFPVGMVQDDSQLYQDIPLRCHSEPPNFAGHYTCTPRCCPVMGAGCCWIRANNKDHDSDSNSNSPSPVHGTHRQCSPSCSPSPPVHRTMSNSRSCHTPVPDSGPTSCSATPWLVSPRVNPPGL